MHPVKLQFEGHKMLTYPNHEQVRIPDGGPGKEKEIRSNLRQAGTYDLS